MRTVLVLATACVAGCTATIPLRPLDPTHPASPEAREAPPVAVRPLATDDAAPAAAAPQEAHHHAH